MKKIFSVILMAATLMTAVSCTPRSSSGAGGSGDPVGGYGSPSRMQQQDQLERMHRDMLRDAYR